MKKPAETNTPTYINQGDRRFICRGLCAAFLRYFPDGAEFGNEDEGEGAPGKVGKPKPDGAKPGNEDEGKGATGEVEKPKLSHGAVQPNSL